MARKAAGVKSVGKTFPTPSLQDVVYCDAAFFDQQSNKAILGIVYGKEVTRIRARAKNGTIAELLAILMARKLYPDKLIINDCKAVIDMFNQNRAISLKHMLGKDSQVDFLLTTINSGGVVWMRRRSDDISCLTDSITRSKLTTNLTWRLKHEGFILREYGF